MLKTLFKLFGTLVGVSILLLAGAYFYYDEPLPQGHQGKEADQLAHKMLEAINFEAWEETNVIQWTFRQAHHFIWHKKRKLVKVRWDDIEVLLNLRNLSDGKVFIGGLEPSAGRQKLLLEKAWQFFINDSFWLIAPTKVFDQGVTRRVVALADGQKALLVTFQSGGVTPGDSYLWILDDGGLPKSYKMWVSIIPVGGLEATWENWRQTTTGVKLPTLHRLPVLHIAMDNVNTGYSLADLGIVEDPFAGLSSE